MKVKLWKARFFLNVVFLEPEPIRGVNESKLLPGSE
jgi:hypothetical protein